MINENGLLYIEPKNECSSYPIDDELTNIMMNEFFNAVRGTWHHKSNTFRINNRWKGIHTSSCGARSTNRDYKLSNGMITNSLCIHYLRWHRDEIPESELDKVRSMIPDITNDCKTVLQDEGTST